MMKWIPTPTSNPFQIILLLIVLVHRAQSHVLVNDVERASSPLPFPPEDTRMAEVRDPPPCCNEGSFHSTDFFASFLISPLGTKITAEYGFSLLFCLAIEGPESLIFTDGDSAAVCKCDCLEGHRASISDLDCTRNFPCKCVSGEGEEKKFPTAPCDPDPLNPKSTEISKMETTDAVIYHARNSTGTGGIEQWDKSRLGLGVSCADFFSKYFTALCSPISDNENNFYTYEVDDQIFQIYPEDICSLDCRFTHGYSKTRPYGRCCTGIDGDNSRYYCHCLE